MFPFQGQPLQKPAWLGPRSTGTRAEFLSTQSRPPTHLPKSGSTWGSRAPRGICSLLFYETGLISLTLLVEKLRPEDKETPRQGTCWPHTWSQPCFLHAPAVLPRPAKKTQDSKLQPHWLLTSHCLLSGKREGWPGGPSHVMIQRLGDMPGPSTTCKTQIFLRLLTFIVYITLHHTWLLHWGRFSNTFSRFIIRTVCFILTAERIDAWWGERVERAKIKSQVSHWWSLRSFCWMPLNSGTYLMQCSG